MVLIELDQIIEVLKSNQGILLNNLSQDIESLHIGRCSIMTDDVTLNRDTQSWH